jgi:hypothetical protein
MWANFGRFFTARGRAEKTSRAGLQNESDNERFIIHILWKFRSTSGRCAVKKGARVNETAQNERGENGTSLRSSCTCLIFLLTFTFLLAVSLFTVQQNEGERARLTED